jgi:uncharacterized protein YuzE
MNYASDAAIAFAMHADTNNLSFEEGERLAQEIAEEIEIAADERGSIPGIRREKELEA